jgi:CBS-domain-containing membrane protein
MQPMPKADGHRYASDVAADTVVQELISIVAGSDLPIRVVEDGRMVGVVDRTAVLEALEERR